MAAIFKSEQTTVEAYVPTLYATDTGRQFEPETGRELPQRLIATVSRFDPERAS